MKSFVVFFHIICSTLLTITRLLKFWNDPQDVVHFIPPRLRLHSAGMRVGHVDVDNVRQITTWKKSKFDLKKLHLKHTNSSYISAYMQTGWYCMQRLCDWVKGHSISVSYIYILFAGGGREISPLWFGLLWFAGLLPAYQQ